MVSPEAAESNPLTIMILSFVFVTISVFAVMYLSANNLSSAGMLLVALVALPSLPMMLRFFDYEAVGIETKPVFGSHTLARHMPLIIVMLAYFVGLVIAFVFWYFALPPDTSAKLFAMQINEIKAINSQFSGYAINMPALAAGTMDQAMGIFETIFMHNLEVLILAIVFSVLYGAGAVLILAWNASVIAIFISLAAKQFVLHSPGESIITGLGIGALGLVPHGTFELLSYSAGALAGGILSSALIKKLYVHPQFIMVINDIAKLLAWAIVFLAVGAFLESGVFG